VRENNIREIKKVIRERKKVIRGRQKRKQTKTTKI
jgi:hypothetical protein